MRSLLTEMKWFKSAARLLDRHFVNKGSLDLSKEVLWISVICGLQSYQLSKLEVKKNYAGQPGLSPTCLRRTEQQKFS